MNPEDEEYDNEILEQNNEIIRLIDEPIPVLPSSSPLISEEFDSRLENASEHILNRIPETIITSRDPNVLSDYIDNMELTEDDIRIFLENITEPENNNQLLNDNGKRRRRRSKSKRRRSKSKRRRSKTKRRRSKSKRRRS
jgi:hypothetical protein